MFVSYNLEHLSIECQGYQFFYIGREKSLESATPL